ncbi:hypothetical protein KI387_013523, partial [Taxus chinensis]
GPWNSWDIWARIGRKTARQSAEQRDSRDRGTRETRKFGSAEGEENRLTAERHSWDIWAVNFRTNAKDANHPDRPKRRTFTLSSLGHLGHENVKDANRPVQPKQRTFVQGHPGQKYARDADSRRNREPITLRHVSSSERGTEKPESGGSEVFVPDSTGTVGTEGREGRENLAGPRTNQVTP